ncbi:hypothetical protein FOFC_17725 [Fusarium oxysporum]|nr:hypothetical protein FOFC_17725 [Fusarium oxysporum]
MGEHPAFDWNTEINLPTHSAIQNFQLAQMPGQGCLDRVTCSGWISRQQLCANGDRLFAIASHDFGNPDGSPQGFTLQAWPLRSYNNTNLNPTATVTENVFVEAVGSTRPGKIIFDWLQIPFQNTCQIHYSQFNTQMPANCHDDEERMIKDGRVDVHPAETSTITTWTNCLAQMSVVMWRHHDHMLRKGSTETDDIDGRYDEVIRADEEIKSLYLSWSDTLRDVNTTSSDNPATDGLPTGLMPAMLLMSIAQKIFTVHRQFQLSCFRDRRYAFSQLSCVTIAKRSIEAFQRWPDCLEARICRRMWTTLSYMISCSITLLFALLFKAQNALTHDWDRLRGYVEFGKDFLGKEAQASSIARRGVRLLGALMELERTSGFSSDIEADIGDTIRRVALAEDDGVEANPGEGYQMVFPYGQDLWESLMRDPTEGELM